MSPPVLLDLGEGNFRIDAAENASFPPGSLLHAAQLLLLRNPGSGPLAEIHVALLGLLARLQHNPHPATAPLIEASRLVAFDFSFTSPEPPARPLFPCLRNGRICQPNSPPFRPGSKATPTTSNGSTLPPTPANCLAPRPASPA